MGGSIGSNLALDTVKKFDEELQEASLWFQ